MTVESTVAPRAQGGGYRAMARFAIPLLVFASLVALLGVGLTLKPREVPSPLVGKPVPEFELPRVRFPERKLARTDLRGKISLLNVWATWCVGCREEHPLLVQIANETGLPVYGLNYKDERDSAIDWLARFGDPYVASGYDASGQVGLDLGVYGLPETFVIDADGNVAYKHIGPITPQSWAQDIIPVLERLRPGRSS